MAALADERADWASLLLRLGLGAVMLPHGLQKTLGWFDGGGFSGTYHAFTEKMHMPAVLAVLVILAESLGAVGLILGLLTRLAGLGIACVMIGAICMVQWNNGFFMNWTGKQMGEGIEYHLLAITMAVVLLAIGGGKWSVDRAIWKKS